MLWLVLLITLILPQNGFEKLKTPAIQRQENQRVISETGLNPLNNDVYEVGFGDGVAPLRGTGAHPLYSLDRDDWVRVRDLQIGERLQTAEGAVSVEALEKVRGTFRVYNLEVEGDHEFLVGDAQVRAHNKNRATGKSSTLKPGPFAKESIPARGPDRRFTPYERSSINRIGKEHGCHTCGTKDPGTKSGNFIPDHQPPNKLNLEGDAQQLYPHSKAVV